MKIYFAGSICGGRQDVSIYREIIKFLKNFGVVLTEHISGANLDERGEQLPPRHVFERDVNWLKDCDIVVAEVTQPSLGVGYEVGTAQSLGKKIVCLYKKDFHNNMIVGNENLIQIRYSNMDELKKKLGNILNSI